MHSKNKIGKILKLLFAFLQSLLFITGISISLIFITLYIKEHRLLEIPFKLLIYVIVIGVLFISISVTGILITLGGRNLKGRGVEERGVEDRDVEGRDVEGNKTKGKNKTKSRKKHIFTLFNTLYVILCLTLLNVLLINIIKHQSSLQKIRGYASTRWNKLSEKQRVFIQNRLECCGYSDSSDRVGGSGCVSSVGCGDRFVKMGESVKVAVQKVWVSVFFIVSLSLAILAMLKMK